MFRLTPWSHGIWFSTDKNIQRSQETRPNFHFLSETLTESESREKVSFKLQPLRGVALSHFPTPPLSSNPSLLKLLLQFPLEQGHLLPTGIVYNPTPLTGTKNRLVPCINSSLLFILVSGSRWAILTPSSAFLLWALEKNCTTSILKCENIGTDKTPPCFSSMCFQSGLLPLFLSTSSTYCEPLWNIFFPVSPAYFDSSWRLHTMHSIW